jgi:hypothetical protein
LYSFTQGVLLLLFAMCKKEEAFALLKTFFIPFCSQEEKSTWFLKRLRSFLTRVGMGSTCSCTQQDPLGRSSRSGSTAKAILKNNAARLNVKRKPSSARNPMLPTTTLPLCHHPKRPSTVRQMSLGGGTTTTPTSAMQTPAACGAAKLTSFTPVMCAADSGHPSHSSIREGDFIDRIIEDDDFMNEDSGKYQPLGSSIFEPPFLDHPPLKHHPSTTAGDGGYMVCANQTATTAKETVVATVTPEATTMTVDVREGDDKPFSLTSAEDDDVKRRKSDVDPW